MKRKASPPLSTSELERLMIAAAKSDRHVMFDVYLINTPPHGLIITGEVRWESENSRGIRYYNRRFVGLGQLADRLRKLAKAA